MCAETERYAITELFRREYANFVRFVRRSIEDSAARDAEDIVQDVALNLFARADLTAPIGQLMAYVYRALRNRVVDEFRKRELDTVPLEAEVAPDSPLRLVDILSDPHDTVAEAIQKDEVRQQLFRAMDTLSSEQKAVIIETEFHGRSFRELSQAWDVPVGTLLARKSRGLQAMRAFLKAYWEESS